VYPAAPRDQTVEQIHGVPVADPYRWLEKADNPAVQHWVEAEDALTRRFLSALPARSGLQADLEKLLFVGDIGSPIVAGGRSFYLLRQPRQEKATLCMRDERGVEHVLIDPNKWAASDHRAFEEFWPSRDGRRVVFATSLNASDRETFQVLDVETGKVSDAIDGIYDSAAAWNQSGTAFYYRWSPTDPAIPLPQLPAHAETRLHVVGDNPAKDRTVRVPTGDPHVTEYVNTTADGHWLILRRETGFSRQDVYVQDVRRTGSPWIPLLVRDNVWSVPVESRDIFYLNTNDGAPKGRVVRIDPAHPDRPSWKEVVSERSDATLRHIRVVSNRIIVHWYKDDTSELEIRDVNGDHPIKPVLPSAGLLSSLVGGPDDAEAFVTFQSYTVPPEVLRIDPAGGLTVWGTVQSSVDTKNYVTEESFYSSEDGTRIPMFIVRRKDVQPTGSNPTLLFGYGGFKIPLVPEFDPEIFAWLDRGGIYAEAGIRGGGDYGDDWHRDGMRGKKQNTFDDYVAGAKALHQWKWTDPDHLVAYGGSNGGLTIGAAITQHPELFRAAYIRAPLFDMIRYPLYGSGEQWTDEYGSPKSEADFRTLLGYSPYHHVKPSTHYPWLLVFSPADDDRMDPMHARKFVAAMQHATSGGPVLLSVASGGHFGADGVSSRVEQYADAYAFALHAVGADVAAPGSR
jgi:prolyl oligopeptidase